MQKGKWSGNKNPNSKLDVAQYPNVLAMYQAGRTTSEVADHHQISQSHVRCILRSLGSPAKHPDIKINQNIADQIRDEYEAGGTSYKKLAEKFQISDTLVYLIIKKKIWKMDNSEQLKFEPPINK